MLKRTRTLVSQWFGRPGRTANRQQQAIKRRKAFLEPLESRSMLVASVVDTSFLATGTLAANANTISVTFSEPVLNAGVAANYELRRAGTDGLLQDSDTVINPSSVNYSGNTATLAFSALVEDVYRLRVKDSITDAAGNALDGDSNSTAGGNWTRDFVVGAVSTTLPSPAPNSYPFDIEFGGFGAGQLVQGPSGAFDGMARLSVGNIGFSPPIPVVASLMSSEAIPSTHLRFPAANTWVSVPGMQATIVSDGVSPIRMSSSLLQRDTSGSNQVQSRFVVDGTTFSTSSYHAPAANVWVPLTHEDYLLLPAGSHTITVEVRASNSSLDYAAEAGFSYLRVAAPVGVGGAAALSTSEAIPSTHLRFPAANTWVSVPGMQATIVSDGVSPIRMSSSLLQRDTSGSNQVQSRFVVDGTTFSTSSYHAPAANVWVPLTHEDYLLLPAGSHTITVEVRASNSALDYAAEAGFSYLRVAAQIAQNSPQVDDVGRTVLTNSQSLSGLTVSREVTVPNTGSQDFARTVDVFTNPTASPITTAVTVVGNLGSDAATVVFKTSDGDSIVETSDQWIGTDDADGTGTPAVIHYIHGPQGIIPASVQVVEDNIIWTYNLTVPANSTVRLAHFTILDSTRAGAESDANALVTANGFGGQAAAFLTAAELGSLANFAYGSMSAVLSGGALTITDTDGTGKNNNLTVSVSGTDLVITDANEQFQSAPTTTPPSSLSNGGKTLTIPFAAITAGLIFNTLGGNDTLNLDFTGGSPLPTGGLAFNGGTGGNDLLSIAGTGVTNATLTHTNANDGSIAIDGKTLAYTGLDPILVNTPGANWVLEYATAAAPVVLAAAGSDLLVTRSGAAEEVTISPAGLASLVVRTGAGADTVEFDSLPAGWSAGIIIDGQGGADVLNVDTAAITTAGSLTLQGIETANLNYNISASTLSGDATTVNVNDAPSGQVQDGVNIVAPGGTVNVAAGTYSENVVLSKQVNLLGAQHNIDARGRVIGAPSGIVESILTAGAGIILELQTGSVGSAIDGFTFLNAFRGIESTSGPINGLQLRNIYMTGQLGNAVFLNDNGQNMTVERNEFVGASGASTVFHMDTDAAHGLHFLNNNVLRTGSVTGTGFFVDGVRNVGTSIGVGGRSPLIQGNRFEGHALGFNAGQRAFDDAQFVENTFTLNTGGLAGGPLDSTIARNTFSSNSLYGLRLTAFGNTSDSARGAQNTTVSNNIFTGNGTTVDLANGYGDIRIDDQFNGTQSTNTIFNNSLGSAIGVFNREANPELINFSGNWWGTNANPETAGKILGQGGAEANVDYTPWLDAGTDTSVAAGFQGNFNNLHIDDDSPQVGATGRITEAIGLLTATGTVQIKAGTYPENVSTAGKSVTVSPGTPASQILLTGDLTLDGNDTLALNIDGTSPTTQYDNFVVTGGLTLGGAALGITAGFTPAALDSFTLISNDAADPVSGIFAGLTPGSVVSVGGVNKRIFYQGNDGNDVVLAPETPVTAYVSNTLWGGLVTGDFILDADQGTTGNQSAIFNYNAFTTVAAAQTATTASGTIIVNAGTYAAAVVGSGTQTIEITGPNAAQAVTFNSLATIAGQNVIIEGTSTLTIGDATSTTIASVISGSGSLVKTGTGSVTLTNANTYGGATTINQGTLTLSGGNNRLPTANDIVFGVTNLKCRFDEPDHSQSGLQHHSNRHIDDYRIWRRTGLQPVDQSRYRRQCKWRYPNSHHDRAVYLHVQWSWQGV